MALGLLIVGVGIVFIVCIGICCCNDSLEQAQKNYKY